MSGKNKEDKLDKSEKKRLKAQHKFEKKQAKLGQPARNGRESTNELLESQPPQPRSATKTKVEDSTVVQNNNKSALPWYKDPNWLKAIAGIASLVVMIIALILSL